MTDLPMDRHVAAMRNQVAGFVSLVRDADLARQVPSCPDWDLRTLAEHLGQAHRFAASNVERRVTGLADLIPREAPPADPAALPDWLAEGAERLIAAVRAAGADCPVWNFTGLDQRAGFWLRRMVHETAVHRADVALTVAAPYRLEPDIAADGISEWLLLVTSPGAAARRPELVTELRGTGQTLHLHATDSPSLGEAGEWVIERGPDAVTWTRGHRKADAAARGLATDLLMLMMRRIAMHDDRIQLFGDVGLFEHWAEHVTF
jgi:uncharacterized protein (TIGR03083 family)